MADDFAITVDQVSKRFRLYNERAGSLKEMITKRQGARYNDFWAVDDISLEVEHGSVYGLCGHNGSGKSTMLKMMAGILKPTSGTVTTDGRISALLELGAGFHPDLSGRENVYLNAAILGLHRREVDAIFDDIVDFSGLSEFIDSPVKHYSSGMFVRLGFSVAVHVNPRILIVDEVIAVGDEEFQRRCFDHVYKLRSEGVTIVMVTHSLNLVRTMCDKAAWFDHGKLMVTGTGNEVVQAYINQVDEAEVERLEAADDRARLAAEANVAVSQSPVRSAAERLVQLDGIELLGPDGVPTLLPHAGRPLTIRLRYTCASPAERPLFSFAIMNEQGVLVANPEHAAHPRHREALRRDGHGRLHDRPALAAAGGVPHHHRGPRQPRDQGVRQAGAGRALPGTRRSRPQRAGRPDGHVGRHPIRRRGRRHERRADQHPPAHQAPGRASGPPGLRGPQRPAHGPPGGARRRGVHAPGPQHLAPGVAARRRRARVRRLALAEPGHTRADRPPDRASRPRIPGRSPSRSSCCRRFAPARARRHGRPWRRSPTRPARAGPRRSWPDRGSTRSRRATRGSRSCTSTVASRWPWRPSCSSTATRRPWSSCSRPVTSSSRTCCSSSPPGPGTIPRPACCTGTTISSTSTVAWSTPACGPSWSPDTLLGANYLGRSFAVRRAAVQAAGGLDPDLGDTSWWDLVLRLDLEPELVVRIPRLLSHLGAPAGRIAGAGHRCRRGPPRAPGTNRSRRARPGRPAGELGRRRVAPRHRDHPHPPQRRDAVDLSPQPGRHGLSVVRRDDRRQRRPDRRSRDLVRGERQRSRSRRPLVGRAVQLLACQQRGRRPTPGAACCSSSTTTPRWSIRGGCARWSAGRSSPTSAWSASSSSTAVAGSSTAGSWSG